MLIQRYERIMGTRVGVQMAVAPASEAEATAAIGRCLDWMREVDARLTRFDARSDLSRLNAAAGTWVPVSEMLYAVVRQSLLAAEASDGLFDPSLAALIETLGYDRDFAALARVPQAARAGQVLWVTAPSGPASGGWRGVEMDPAGRRIRLPRGVRLDLGGIAKGWAADEALARFFAPDASVLIDVGGDIRAQGGPEPEQPWPIALSPATDVTLEEAANGPVIALGAGGVAVSGVGARWWYHGAERQHHLLDPRTAQPAHLWIDANDSTAADPDEGEPLIAAVAALSPSTALAEVAAKVAILRGWRAALALVEGAWDRWTAAGADEPAGYTAAPGALIVMLRSGAVVGSRRLDMYLNEFGGRGNAWLS